MGTTRGKWMVTGGHRSAGARGQRGFTLIEMLTVVAILGILAAIAIGAYTRQVRNAHKSEVFADLSNLTLRQKTFKNVSGHFASSAIAEGAGATYPTGAQITAAEQEVVWVITDAGYRGPTANGALSRGGEPLHGFDVLRFMPEAGRSWCGYATISDWGSNAIDPANPTAVLSADPPSFAIADEVFPAGSEDYYASDWFYSYALCDFDSDGTYWAFTTTHYSSDINFNDLPADGSLYRENE